MLAGDACDCEHAHDGQLGHIPCLQLRFTRASRDSHGRSNMQYVILLLSLCVGASGLHHREPLPFVDVCLYNGEADILRYRIKLHAPFTSAFVIVESNVTFSGKPKQTTSKAFRKDLREEMTPAEATIHSLSVPLAHIQDGVRAFWIRESTQRTFLLLWLKENYPAHRIYVSDVDEFLDAGAMLKSRLMFNSDCFIPTLRFYYYGEHCPMRSKWVRAIIFRSSSSFFTTAVHRQAELRATDTWTRDACPPSRKWMGWHFSYALKTADILQKLRSFAHAKDGFVSALLAGNVTAKIEDRISRCADLFGRAGETAGMQSSAFDGHLPQLPGWPRHPLAP